jgi:hypothetical protein
MSNKITGFPYFYKEKIDNKCSKHIYILLIFIIALGLTLRLWGLGNAGLHGDEETTAMPAIEILKSGLPRMPSGMVYPRAPLQSYMIALSIWIFGKSEWALRFPSALAGTLAIAFAFFLGRRFLSSKWNMLFALTIALNPWMITWSQTARMYIFLSTSLILFAAFVFRWEEDDSWRSLLAAIIVYLIAQQFHTLAIFSSSLFFYPYIAKPSTKKIVQGSTALAVVLFAFVMQKSFEAAQYGSLLARSTSPEPNGVTPFQFILDRHLLGTGFIALLCLVALGMALYLQKERSRTLLSSLGLFISTIVAAFVLQYHVAFILYCGGVILYTRSRGRKIPLCALTFLILLLFSYQFSVAYDSNLYPSIRKISKAFIGSFSIYPYIEFIRKVPIGFVLYIIPFLYAARAIATRKSVPDHFLFFIISAWLPLFGEGLFRWYFFPRFTFQFLPFFVLSCFPAVLYLRQQYDMRLQRYPFKSAFLAACILIVGFIQPVKLAYTINPVCERFPDHRGAASFMRAVPLKDSDFVLAEDVLQQVYYFGNVDYWLRGIDDAKNFVREKNGTLVDIYTNTALLGTGEELEQLLRDRQRGFIYIIGSGENVDFQSYYLSNNILDIINKYKPYGKIIYKGCDNKTLIWKFRPIR